jgi:hypothetical protein
MGHLNLIKLYILYNHGSYNLNSDFSKLDLNELTKFREFMNSFADITSYVLLEKYIMVGQYFKLNYNRQVNMNDAYLSLLNDNKEHFRYLCFRNINYIKNIEININSFSNSSKHNETVFIEFRNFHHIEFNIRNMCIKLPNWKHTVICGKDNYTMVKSICNRISSNINIINTQFTLRSIDEYSILLGSVEFWKLLTGEHILIHQDDSLILDSTNIEKFLEYDYVGAVWPSTYPENYLVGNGGFSLRKRELMITICETYNIKTYNGFEVTKKYMNEHKLTIIPEDCFFVKCIVDNNLGKIAPYDKAKYFSYESVYEPNTIGCHCSWLNNRYWMDDFSKIIKQYYCEGIIHLHTYEHRYGWKYILGMLYINDIITPTNNSSHIQLIDLSEKHFIWDNKKAKNKWVGILHLTPDSPPHVENINALLTNNNFIDSLPVCQNLICLTDYLSRYVISKIDTNVVTMYHPMINIEHRNQFNIIKYKRNTNKKIIQIGRQCRNLKTFTQINFNTHGKLWLTGTQNMHATYEILKLELNINIIHDSYYNIEYKYVNNKEYDELIVENILFLHVHDASANNVVLEAIVYKIPIVVNKHPAIIEYLGEDYPLYFEPNNDSIKIDDDFISIEKITEAHEYLKLLDIDKIQFLKFNQALLRIIT